MYSEKLGAYLAEHPDCKGVAYSDGDGKGSTIEGWDEKTDGPPPTHDEVESWNPAPADPDKAHAPSLEVREYKGLLTTLEDATTIGQVKAVLRAYLRKRARL